MNKKVIIIIIACVLVAILGLLLLMRRPSTPPLVTTIDPAAIPTETKILIPAKSGNIETNNFLKTAVKITPERAELITNTDLGLTYSPADATFHATISAVDNFEFIQKQQELESYILDQLDLTKDEACQLRVIIRTLPSPTESISDKTLPLRFCQE